MKHTLSLIIIATLFLSSCGQQDYTVLKNIQPHVKNQTGSTNTGAVLSGSTRTGIVATGMIQTSSYELKDTIIAQIKKGDTDTDPYVSIESYDMDTLEQDAQSQSEEQTFIQRALKEKNFQKLDFVHFFQDLASHAVDRANATFTRHDILVYDSVMHEKSFQDAKTNYGLFMSPFYPTCCSSKYYLTNTVYKNGIFGIAMNVQEVGEYYFYYMTAYSHYLVEFQFKNGFTTDPTSGTSYNQKNMNLPKDLPAQKYFQDLFSGKYSQPDFTRELEKAKQAIDDLYINK